MRRSFLVVALCAVLMGVLGGMQTAAAQEATPDPAAPIVVPAPNQCTIEPRDVAFFEGLDGTPAAGTSAAASPVVESSVDMALEGEPADREVRAAVLDTVRQVLACVNAGNFLAFTALYSDDYYVRDAANAGGPTAGDIAALVGDPVPLTGDLAALLAILDVRTLDDGRVAVLVDIFDPRLATPTSVRVLYTMVEQDGRYVIDTESREPIDEFQVGTPAA